MQMLILILMPKVIRIKIRIINCNKKYNKNKQGCNIAGKKKMVVARQKWNNWLKQKKGREHNGTVQAGEHT